MRAVTRVARHLPQNAGQSFGASITTVPGLSLEKRAYSATLSPRASLQEFYGTRIEPIVAPLIMTKDVVDNLSLRSTAAMRMASHHLHANADMFLPSTNHPVNIYCVAQACVTYSIPHLTDKLRTVEECMLKDSTTVGIVPLISDMWVEKLGRTSITFGHALTYEQDLLALVTRVVARQDSTTGKLLLITDEERSEIFPAAPEDLALPTVARLNAPLDSDMDEIFQVKIGPQHLHMNNLVDPVALAELVFQGLAVRGYPYERRKVILQYLAPARLHQTLSCRIHASQPLIGLYNATTEISPGKPLVLACA